jgi:hypothetical protein
MVTSKYRLVRKEDGLVKQANDISWVEWDERGSFKELHNEPKVGYSAILGPRSISYSWLTTPITEILEQREDYLHFKTENSEYELFKEEDLTDKDLMS